MWSIRIRPQPKRSASAATLTTAPVSLPRSKVFSTDSWHWSVEKSARTLDNKVLLQFSWYKLIWYQIGGSWNRSALKWQRFIIGCLCSYPALWGSLRSLDRRWQTQNFCLRDLRGQKQPSLCEPTPSLMPERQAGFFQAGRPDKKLLSAYVCGHYIYFF